MSISALKAITMARPGIEARGTVVGPRDIENTIIRGLGFQRRLISKLGLLKRVPLINRLGLVKASSALREFIKGIQDNIEASGIKQGFVCDHSLIYDPDCKLRKIPYDPAVDLGSVAIKRLLDQTKIDPKEIGALYVACTSFNSADPPLGDRILAKLIRDGVIKEKDFEANGTNGNSPWVTKTIAEGCVGWIRLVEEVERDMQLKQLQGGVNKYALGVAIAVNSIHINGINPHEIIAYKDGAAAGLFIPRKDNSGPFIIGPLKQLPNHADLVVHPFKVPRALASVSNYVDSRKVAKIIAENVPEYLEKFLEERDFQVTDLDHIIISQTSKGILDRTVIELSETFIKKQNLNLKPNQIREVLKKLIEIRFGDLEKEFETKKRSILSNYFLRVVETNQGAKIYEYLNNDERKLFDFMMVLYNSIYRVYDKHSYTGVASIPMALAQGVEDKVIELNHPMLWLGSGLGIKFQGLLSVDPNYQKLKADSDCDIKVVGSKETVEAGLAPAHKH